MENVNRPVPEENKTYHFYDDGKCSVSRHYYATVEEVVSKDEIEKNDKELFNLWKDLKQRDNWIFAEDTDYFVKADVHFYFNPKCHWFVRTVSGGWFSLIDNWIGGGELDVDEKMTNKILEWSPDYLKAVEKDAIKTLLDRIHNNYYETLKKYENINSKETNDNEQ